MPHRAINGCSYFYDEYGSGPETIAFGHGFLLTHRVWEAQIRALSDRYRCIVWDWRGQGRSSAPESGYDVPTLARDAVALLGALDATPCHYVGLSMGGFVGFDLLTRHANVLQSAILLGTDAADESLPRRLRYTLMLETVRRLGWDAVLQQALPLLFGPTFRHEHPEAVAQWAARIATQDPEGIARAGYGIFRRENRLVDLGTARTPTLLLVGSEDRATPPARSRDAHEALPNSQWTILPRAGHSLPIERPEAVTRHLRSFVGAPGRAELHP
jgi:pimeloyl-ACP methyl ester carboxylesterase